MSTYSSPSHFFRRHIRFYFASGMITFAIPLTVQAENLTSAPVVTAADFDSSFLIGDAQKVDISTFRYGNPILAGEYNVDIYVNNTWFGKRRVQFKNSENKSKAQTCFTETQLLEYGVKKQVLTLQNNLSSTGCYLIEQWIEAAFYEFDSSRLRLDISIPQIALQKNAQGYIDPSVWNRGINAGFLSYSGSAYKIFNRDSNHNKDSTNAFLSLNTGINLASWQLRHNGQWQWLSQPADGQARSDYQANSTYLQRAFPNYRGMVTIGDSFTDGEVFDSLAYRGVDFSSDDRMLPNSMLGYAPQIRGNAKTNAKVEIRQQGQLLYQTTVAAGSFEINDLYPTGFGGELEVSVIEANGEIQRFAVPYSSVVQMLRPGLNRYSATLGQFRDHHIDATPWFGQIKYQHGINNYLTGYTGLQVAENYAAILLGSAIATPIGSIAFDVTQSNADFEHQGSKSGQSFKLSYSKLFSPTNTNLTLAAYRYSTEDFYRFRDAVWIQDLESKGIDTHAHGKQRSEFQITLNQGLSQNWGNIYVVGSWLDYWNRNETLQQYQIGYTNNYRGLTYGLSANKRQVQYGSTHSSNDTEYMMSLSFPLDFKTQSINVNTAVTQHSQNIGISSMVNDRFSYGASFTRQDYSEPSLNINGRYRTNYATLTSSYSIADRYQQAMLNVSGNIVAHAGGVLFGAEQGQTMVLVYAPDAAGAKVNNVAGLSINKAGYAVIPYVTPYRLNDVTLDPQNMSTRVELEESSQRIAPFAGAIAKVDFNTKKGYAIYIHTRTKDGGHLPFAAQVTNQDQQVVGMVAQGSMIYLRSPLSKDHLQVHWGENNTVQCHIDYDISQQLKIKQQDAIVTEAICQ